MPVSFLWAAQPAHAADRLPRRVPSILALVSRLLVKYTCRQSHPANEVAVRLLPLACRVAGRKTSAADARRWADKSRSPRRLNDCTGSKRVAIKAAAQ